MKITFVLGSLGRGGAERVISILSREYAKKGWETDIILLLSGKVEYDVHPDTKIIDFSANMDSRIGRVRRIPYWLKNIRGYMRQNKPDVIISFVARINIITQIACSGLKQKIIVSERNDPKSDGRSFLVRMLTNYYYPKAYKVVFQTKRAMAYFKGLKNGTIISNPIEVNIPAKQIKKHKVVTIGRLTQQKNHKLLISAFSKIHKEHPEYTLEIYGDGELKEELVTQISKENMNEHIFLMGNKKDVHEYISDAEIFALSSNYEGQSNALLEAMMMGMPCISTNCAGSDEIIEDGINGLIVPVGDCNSLSIALNKLINNSVLRHSISENAAKSVEKFKTEYILTKWNDLITQVESNE